MELTNLEKTYYPTSFGNSGHARQEVGKRVGGENECSIIDKHPCLRKKRDSNLAEYKIKTAKLKECLEEQENLKAPIPVSDPGKINYVKVAVWYVVAIATFAIMLGYLVFIWETIVVWNHKRKIKRFAEYTREHEYFLEAKQRLKTEIPLLKRNVAYLKEAIHSGLYSELNEGCAIPISRQFITPDNWERIDKKLDVLVNLYSQYKQAENSSYKRSAALEYFNMKLQFFYEESIQGETTASVYSIFNRQLSEAMSKNDLNLLRHDSEEEYLLSFGEYEFKNQIERYKYSLENMSMEHALYKYDGIKNLTTIGSWGFADIDKLADKTEELRRVYQDVTTEYEKLQDITENVNYFLTYVRSIAYRNIYLGAELLNFIKDVAGGKKLMAQKDCVVTETISDVANFSAEQLRMNASDNISSTLSDMLKTVAQDKSLMKFAVKNPKMMAGAAALNVIGNLLEERSRKINENVELQKQFIDNIGKMVDGYNSGKAGLLRSIEIIKALSKANIGFLAIYAPLRDKFFVEGSMASMLDLHKLAKATRDYKHISDAKL